MNIPQASFLPNEELQKILNSHNLKLVQEINQTEYSQVFKVQTQTNQFAALKIMQVSIKGSGINVNQLMPLKIEDPYFVKYYDSFFVEPNFICYLMEYCEGGSAVNLMQILKRGLNEREINAIVLLTLKALQNIHSKGIIHNDIKAGNILFTPSGQLKIVDTYVANAVSLVNELDNHSLKSPPTWKAPEYLEENVVKGVSDVNKMHLGLSEKSDIWSLGITILEMFSEKPPNSEVDLSQLQILYCTTLKMPSAPKSSSILLQNFVKKLLVKQPSSRPDVFHILSDPFIKQITLDQAMDVIKDLSNQYIIFMKEKLSDESDENDKSSDSIEIEEDEESSSSEEN
ncbi:Serine/threonine-protein kinase 4 [Tritrichomonas musculus]|uniref:Serine/threonine-protein kinase 4 n=1 Tax=Tritrichomonas musculus TaxID=1915356 RepID=A0ABR2KSX8_9EUKA